MVIVLICPFSSINYTVLHPLDRNSLHLMLTLPFFQETYTETQTEYLPELLRQITLALTTFCDHLTESELTISLKLCAKILNRVLPSMTPVGGSSEAAETTSQTSPFKGLRPNFHQALDTDTDGLVSESESYISADSNIDGFMDSPARKMDDKKMKTSTPEKKQGTPEKNSKKEEKDSKGKIVDISTLQKSSKPELKPKPAVGPKPDVKPKPELPPKPNKDKEKPVAKNESFGDFMQYDSKSPPMPATPQKTLKMDSASMGKGSQTLMQACVHSFQELFQTIVF